MSRIEGGLHWRQRAALLRPLGASSSGGQGLWLGGVVVFAASFLFWSG